jgi:hypothetical protein
MTDGRDRSSGKQEKAQSFACAPLRTVSSLVASMTGGKGTSGRERTHGEGRKGQTVAGDLELAGHEGLTRGIPGGRRKRG